jgi:predicted CoA-binding protein
MDPAIRDLLRSARVIAVVGLSDNPGRPSYHVAEYLQEQGYRVIPVNPTITEALGEKAYASLGDVPEAIDVVDVFRRSDAVPPVVDEAIAVGAKAVWMQEGVVNEPAAEKARAAGLTVVMDRCILKEHAKLPS